MTEPEIFPNAFTFQGAVSVAGTSGFDRLYGQKVGDCYMFDFVEEEDRSLGSNFLKTKKTCNVSVHLNTMNKSICIMNAKNYTTSKFPFFIHERDIPFPEEYKPKTPTVSEAYLSRVGDFLGKLMVMMEEQEKKKGLE
jgi:hypothetical protein